MKGYIDIGLGAKCYIGKPQMLFQTLSDMKALHWLVPMEGSDGCRLLGKILSKKEHQWQ